MGMVTENERQQAQVCFVRRRARRTSYITLLWWTFSNNRVKRVVMATAEQYQIAQTVNEAISASTLLIGAVFEI